MEPMKYQKYEGLRPNTEMLFMKKESGKITWVMGLFLLTFIMLLAVTQLQILKFRAASDIVSDALAAGGLAAELIDIERYGFDHAVIISDAEGAYQVYKRVLPDNLGVESLDDGIEEDSNMTSEADVLQESVIRGPIIIEKFYIYNVVGDMVETVKVDDNGVYDRKEENLGEVYAPNGKIVRSTGIYSEISFGVNGLFGNVFNESKGKLVEINTAGNG